MWNVLKWKPTGWAYILLASIVFLSYGNSLENGFTYDDEGLIVHNAFIKDVSHWPKLFTTHYWAGIRDPGADRGGSSGLYRPLVSLSYALNYQADGVGPFWYHAVNVLLHLLVVWLVFLTALAVGIGTLPSLVAAALFAAHPIHTEVVAGVAGRAELMMAAGFLGSVVGAARGLRLASLLCYCFALGSKEQAVMLLPVLGLYDLAVARIYAGRRGRDVARMALSRYLPYGLATLVFLCLRWWIIADPLAPHVLFLANPLGELDLWRRWTGAIQVAGWYLWLCVWPRVLSFDYSYQSIILADTFLDPAVLLSGTAWFGLLALAVWSYPRRGAVTFSIGLLFLPFLPVSNLFIPIGTIMGERLFYLPSAGLALLAGIAFERSIAWSRRFETAAGAQLIRIGAWAVVLAVCAGFVIRTAVRNRDWRDTEHLARAAVEAYPHNARLHSILGRIAKGEGDWDSALAHFRKAVELYPQYVNQGVSLNTNMGIALIQKGFVEEGVKAIERAAQIEPGWSQVHYNLGLAYKMQGRYREAEAAYERALSLNQGDPRAYTGLGFLYLETGRYRDALAAAERALQRDATYIEALYAKARALELLNHRRAAAEAYARIVELNPWRETIARKVEELRRALR